MTSKDKTLLPPWMSLVHDSLESHLKTYESPLLEILPHPTPDRGRCGDHEANKAHLHHFCLFLCCAKKISWHCLETAASGGAFGGEGEEEKERLGRTAVKESEGEKNELVGNGRTKISGEILDGIRGGDDNEASSEYSKVRIHQHLSLSTAQLSRLSLIAQPEDYRSWNVLKHPLLNARFELKFAYFILTKHPRSAETYCHLRFLSRLICCEAKNAFDAKKRLCGEGFAKCEEAASRYHGNYHAWDHRRFLMSLLIDESEENDDFNPNNDEISSMTQRELNDVKSWQSTRVSDACPFKYRLFLVEIRSKAGLRGVEFDFFDELTELNRLMTIYPGHESLWNYRRDFMKLARGEGQEIFERLSREDAAFLSDAEMNSKNDWEITLHDRYQSQIARI